MVSRGAAHSCMAEKTLADKPPSGPPKYLLVQKIRENLAKEAGWKRCAMSASGKNINYATIEVVA